MIEKTRKAERTSRVSTSIAYEIVRPGCRKDKRDKHGNAPLVCGRSPAKKDGMHSRQNDGAFQTPCLSVSASGRTKKRKGLSGVHLTHFLQQTLAGGGLFLLAHDARLFEVLALLQEESTQKRGFEMIVAQYSEQLYWQIRRMVLSHEDANDLLQNTFVKAWLNIDYFRAEAKLSTWLYRIALNECLTFLNKQRAASTVSLDAPEADTLQKLESDPYFSGDKAQMALQKALLTLPEKQRMVFNLKYYQEMKYEQMSDIFGTSVGALKASYHHAVKKIEKILGEED